VETIPLQFSAIDLSARGGSARMVSAAAHGAIICAALMLATIPNVPPKGPLTIVTGGTHPLLKYEPPQTAAQAAVASLGKDSGEGENNPIQTKKGWFASLSSMPIVPPRKIVNANPEMPAPPAVFDAHAPEIVPVVTDLGLPTMKEQTDSAGPGDHHGFGTGHKGGMGSGDQDGRGVGIGEFGTRPIVSRVVCAYCPEPPYTEEARKAKLQGGVTVEVLVGADGRAREVRVLKGLGMGLDESAIAAVRAWRFTPAMDGQRRPMATWVTVETRFQLF